MNFLRKLFGGGTGSDDRSGYYLYIRSNYADECIRIRVNLQNDLDPQYEETGSDYPVGYELHKEVMGNKAFQLIYVDMKFDRNKQPASEATVRGGKLISREEYEQCVAETQSPPQPSQQ